jgi:hypothetical protein
VKWRGKNPAIAFCRPDSAERRAQISRAGTIYIDKQKNMFYKVCTNPLFLIKKSE